MKTLRVVAVCFAVFFIGGFSTVYCGLPTLADALASVESISNYVMDEPRLFDYKQRIDDGPDVEMTTVSLFFKCVNEFWKK